jgi:very-short-patch-repair endonuclease
MDPLWLELLDFTGAHHGAISVPEATALGIPPYRLAKWTTAGRLERAAPGLYLIAGVPDSWHRRVRVATGSGAAWASHRTAAGLSTLDGFDRRTIEVVTAHGRRRRRSAWKVHESRTLQGVDLTFVETIPTTTVPRTLLDLPAVAHPYLIAKALDHACRREPGGLDRIVQRHRELPQRGRRGVRLINDMLAERLGLGRFADSDFETMAARLVRSVGLPEPVLQHEVRDGEFVAFLDLAWPDIRWSVECDSLAHHSGKGPHEWDRARRRKLKRLGWDTIEITYDDVTTRRQATGRELRELYELRRSAVARGGALPTVTGGSDVPIGH